MPNKTNNFRVSRTKQLFLSVFALALLVATFSMSFNNSAEAGGAISGTVYIDYNMNGIRETSGIAPNYAVDAGASGVTVTAYDSSGTARGTVNTSATGTYTLNATGTGPYRLEFTNLPSGYNPSAVGTNNATNVRFVPDGNSSNVDFGIVFAETYCQNNPDLFTSCFVGGAQNGANANLDVLINFPYSAGTAYNDPTVANYDNPSSHSVFSKSKSNRFDIRNHIFESQ